MYTHTHIQSGVIRVRSKLNKGKVPPMTNCLSIYLLVLPNFRKYVYAGGSIRAVINVNNYQFNRGFQGSL